MAKPTAGFIGLGAMGYQMARHMVLKGFDVYGIVKSSPEVRARAVRMVIERRGGSVARWYIS